MDRSEAVIETLHPAFRDRARRALANARAQMPKGTTVELIEGVRDLAVQAEKKAAGLSGVTIGWHQFGLAFDYGIFENGKYIEDGSDRRYEKAVYAMTANDPQLISGASWRKPDVDHIEWHPGFTLAQYQAWLTTYRDLFHEAVRA